MLGRVLERGHLRAGWVAGDDAFGMSPSFRVGLAAQADVVRAGRSRRPPPSGPLEPAWTSAAYQGFGRLPESPSWWTDSGGPSEQRSEELPFGETPGEDPTLAEGSQGPQEPYVQRPGGCGYHQEAQARRDLLPFGPSWPPATWTAGEPRYYVSNRSGGYPAGPWHAMGGSRWRIETEFETEKSDGGWTSTRPGHGRDGITTWP